ncbi:MAG: YicC/YloC family endoribonuclease [Pseudomonadota bacterium]
MVNSMTAFGSANGANATLTWTWEIRSVNGRGLDIRLRMPDGCDPLDQPVRKSVSAAAQRGTINVGLKLKRVGSETQTRLNEDGLAQAIEAAQVARTAAEARGMSPGPVEISALLTFPGVLTRVDGDTDLTPHIKAMTKTMQAAVDAFQSARAAEGTALASILTDQISRIDTCVADARATLPDRAEKAAAAFRANVAKLLDTTEGLDEARIAQELAILAVKGDVAEELDRLDAHIKAARDLLQQDGPIGRKFDFLTQEFNREANTLCSKSGHEGLTRIGLDLKTVIDQMREQVQNVE